MMSDKSVKRLIKCITTRHQDIKQLSYSCLLSHSVKTKPNKLKILMSQNSEQSENSVVEG